MTNNTENNHTYYDVIIIGAGAAGMMCAIEAGKRGRKVLILEKADKVGKKILISGGGRCNFTNLYTEPENFISQNEHFCKSALSRYTQWDFIALLESHELSWTEKTLGQLFCDQKSKAIVQMLVDECTDANVKIELNEEIISIRENDDQYTIATPQVDYYSNSLVIATGGPSIPKMGATDYALKVSDQYSLSSIPFTAALVPFTIGTEDDDAYIKELSGLSTYVEISVLPQSTSSGKEAKRWGVHRHRSAEQQNNIPSFKENILFTHRGISGPAALQISSYWQLGDNISINLFPEFDLFDWLKSQQTEHPQAEFKTVLAYKLPKRLVVKLCEYVISPDFAQKKLSYYSHEQFQEVIEQLENWKITPTGTEGLRTAEVALGGIDTDALSSKTFEAKNHKGLYFIGEAIDVTGHLGGFNFQWAWASGWCAGQVV